MPKLSAAKTIEKPIRGLKSDTVSDKDRAFVYYEKGATVSVGEFEFVRVNVGVNAPINMTEEIKSQIEVTIESLDKIVSKELEFQINELK